MANPRAKIVRDRIERVETLKQKIPHVRVLPANDEIRKYFTHPDGNIGFPATGAADWPLDQFTQRRLRDGTITVEGGAVPGRHAMHHPLPRPRPAPPPRPVARKSEPSPGGATS